MSNPSDSILIAGTGAMACLFAARLSATGIPVTMLGTWKAGLETLQNEGVTIIELDGSQHTYPVMATSDTKQCAGARYALVLVKSWQTWRTGRQLHECLIQEGVALTLQNGIGNREALSQTLGAKRVALGVTTIGAHLLGPGRIKLAGEGVITLGIHSRLGPLADMLRSSSFVVENDPDPDVLLWGKLVINAAINPLTALMGVPNGELLKRPTARSLMVALAREAAAVAVALGVRLPYPDPVVATESIARRTANNRSSMLMDVERGAPTEIDAICGAIIRSGEQTSVPTPVNRTIWQLVKALSPSTKQP
jgi:2-dehydropantoate 2-reductase